MEEVPGAGEAGGGPILPTHSCSPCPLFLTPPSPPTLPSQALLGLVQVHLQSPAVPSVLVLDSQVLVPVGVASGDAEGLGWAGLLSVFPRGSGVPAQSDGQRGASVRGAL